MHTKILIRTDSFIEHYQHWLQKDVKDVIAMLSGSYANEVFGKGADDLKHELSEISERIIWHPKFLKQQIFGFLIDLFKTKLIAFAGYQLMLSDERQEIFDNGLRVIVHRHTLKREKGVRRIIKSDIDHDFRNLMIEHQYDKNKNTFILTATYRPERSESSFEKLMEYLLS